MNFEKEASRSIPSAPSDLNQSPHPRQREAAKERDDIWRSSTQPMVWTPDVSVLDTAPVPALARISHFQSADDVSIAVENVRPELQNAPAGANTLVKGAASLIVREGILRVAVLAANVILARVLNPRDFGVFAILEFFNVFLATFGTFGLGPSIVQRREEPSKSELASLFTFQTGIAAILVIVASSLAPELASRYNLGTSGTWLVSAMAVGFLFSSSAATPMALLERRMAFGRVALAEVTTGVLFQVIAVGLAIAGLGVWSLVVGTVVSNGIGAAITFAVAGWMPHISFRFRHVLSIIWFGLQFQVNTFISLMSGYIAPTFVSLVLGAAAVGYITWATTLAFYPLIFVYLIGRVTFPMYARSIDDKPRLQRILEGTIRVQSYVICALAAIIVGLAPELTVTIFGNKWLPAVPLLYFLVINTVFSMVNNALTTALNALGKPTVVTKLMLMWLVLDWSIIVPFVLWKGIIGYAMAQALISLTVVIVTRVFRHYQSVRIFSSVAAPIVSAGFAGGLIWLLSQKVPANNILLLTAESGVTVAMFVLFEVVIDRHFFHDVRIVVREVLVRAKER